MIKFNIYKDDYKRFIVCPKFMWLMRYRKNKEIKEWAQERITFLHKENEKKFYSSFEYKKNTEVKTELDVRIVSGIWFQEKIINLFKTKYKIFDFDLVKIKNSKEKFNFTKKIIESPKYQAYHEAYFSYKKYVTKCDLIIKNNNEELDIYEIKGVNKIELKERKEEFKKDLTYQCWILKKLNFKVRNIFILHLNEEYLRYKKLEEKNLYTINNTFNKESIKNADIELTLNKIYNLLEKNFIEIKEKILGTECHEFDNVFSYCTQIIPKVNQKYNWLQLYRMRRKDKVKIYHQNKCQNIDLRDIDIEKFKLTLMQKRSIRVVQDKEPLIKDREIVLKELKKYQLPIYFYDFETTALAIPKFNNSSPWNQIPFQYSIHVIRNSNFDWKTGKNIKHFEFIANKLEDPRIPFIKKFIKDMNAFGPGICVAYNSSFEKQILKKILQNLQLKEKEMHSIQKIIDNTLDIKDFFKNFNIYHKNFYGSLSIKKTLPALIKNIDYTSLKIQDGSQASATYFNYINKLMSQKEWNKKIYDMKEYCKLDSLAMIAIYKKIIDLSKSDY